MERIAFSALPNEIAAGKMTLQLLLKLSLRYANPVVVLPAPKTSPQELPEAVYAGTPKLNEGSKASDARNVGYPT